MHSRLLGAGVQRQETGPADPSLITSDILWKLETGGLVLYLDQLLAVALFDQMWNIHGLFGVIGWRAQGKLYPSDWWSSFCLA